VSKVQDCSLGKIRLLLKNSLGFVYDINESSLFAINNNASNGKPLVKILNQDFIKSGFLNVDSINLQLLIADPEKESVTINLFVSYDNGMKYKSFDSFKESAQIDTVYRMVYLNKLWDENLVLKAEISDNGSNTADSTLSIFNFKGIKTSAELDMENSEIEIYPNPFSDDLSIQTSGNREYSVELTTITGHTVYQSKTEGNFHRINVRDLSRGIYFVRMKSNNIVSVRKVIKQ
jgi:hypothetical protein